MKIVICADYDELSLNAAGIVAGSISRKPDLVLGLVAGDTPAGLYRNLVARHREEKLSFAKVTVFLMNEFLGLGRDHPGSLFFSLRENLFDRVDLVPGNIRALDGLAPEIEKHCLDFEDQMKKAGGVDLQVLGIGRDGHIGFNEPGSSLSSHTRRKALNETTIEDRKKAFANPDEVPRHALTAGIGTILQASEILLMASGRHKAEAVAEMIEGPISSRVTASILQVHPKVTVLIDEPAAGCLENVAYYRYLQEQSRRYDRSG